jgi:antirestriction protein ArdC
MKSKCKSERGDVYERVTNQIIEAIERGAGQWRMPWHKLTSASAPVNAVSRKPYRGVNVLSLWATAIERGYQSSIWATYAQWQQLGAQVRKGEESAFIVFWKFDRDNETQTADTDTDEQERRSILARGYHVFNAEQVDGFALPQVEPLPEAQRIEAAEQFFSHVGAEVRHGGNRAFYSPAHDFIQLPPFAIFKETAAYYATLGHECIHWSGAPHRLNRDLKGRFGEEAYAAEELVAELGAAFLCADLGIANEPRPDHAAYVQHWLSVLRNDKRAIFTAASKAQVAVDWMHDRQPETSTVPMVEATA